jgi:hypothetical protein
MRQLGIGHAEVGRWRGAMMGGVLLGVLWPLMATGSAMAGEAPGAAPVAEPATVPAAAAIEAPVEALAFRYADYVVAIEIGSGGEGEISANVTQQWRGHLVARVARPVQGLPAVRPIRAGDRWLVAAARGGLAGLRVLAALEDTPANRKRVEELAPPAWTYTPLVMVARIKSLSGWKENDGHPVFEPVKVLRGMGVPEEFMENGFIKYEKYIPLAAGDRHFIVSAWSITRTAQEPRAFAHIESMEPVDAAGEAAVAKAVAEAAPLSLEPWQKEPAAVELARTAWIFNQSAVVAEVKVVALGSEGSDLGGRHLFFGPEAYLRGDAPAEVLERVASGGRGFPVMVARGEGERYLFTAGGHGYMGREKEGDRLLAAGAKAGGLASDWIAADEGMRRRAEAWLKARPLLACLEAREEAYNGAPPAVVANADLEPAVSLDRIGGGSLMTFEVVRTRVAGEEGGVPVRVMWCRAIESPPTSRAREPAGEEWLLGGAGLPEWPAGSRWQALVVTSQNRGRVVTAPPERVAKMLVRGTVFPLRSEPWWTNDFLNTIGKVGRFWSEARTAASRP